MRFVLGRLLCRIDSRAVFVQEGYDLGAGAGLAGTEDVRRSANGDLILRGPEDGLVIISIRVLHIVEGAFRDGGLGTVGGAPEEGNDLSAGTDPVRGGGRLGGAGGNAILHSPKDSHVIVVVHGHVCKGTDCLYVGIRRSPDPPAIDTPAYRRRFQKRIESIMTV